MDNVVKLKPDPVLIVKNDEVFSLEQPSRRALVRSLEIARLYCSVLESAIALTDLEKQAMLPFSPEDLAALRNAAVSMIEAANPYLSLDERIKYDRVG